MISLFPDLIDTSITLIQHNRAKIWAQARKDTVCMHTSLHAEVSICAQKWPVCPPGLIDTSIFLIGHNGAKIWAKACKNTVCMHTSLCAQVSILLRNVRPVHSVPRIDFFGKNSNLVFWWKIINYSEFDLVMCFLQGVLGFLSKIHYFVAHIWKTYFLPFLP